MNQIDTKRTYAKAVKTWGLGNRFDMIIEEASELIQAISKFKRKGDQQAYVNLVEECADTLIAIESLSYALRNELEINNLKAFKLNRLHNILEEHDAFNCKEEK